MQIIYDQDCFWKKLAVHIDDGPPLPMDTIWALKADDLEIHQSQILLPRLNIRKSGKNL